MSTVASLFLIGASTFIIARLWSLPVQSQARNVDLGLSATSVPTPVQLNLSTEPVPTTTSAPSTTPTDNELTTNHLAKGYTVEEVVTDNPDATETLGTDLYVTETTIIPRNNNESDSSKERSFNMELTTLSTLLLSFQNSQSLLRNDTGTNNPNDKLGSERSNGTTSYSSLHVKGRNRTPKTILYACVIIISIIATGMLLHLLVFHMYICTKGLTTYEYLKPPPVTEANQSFSPPPAPSTGRKSVDKGASNPENRNGVRSAGSGHSRKNGSAKSKSKLRMENEQGLKSPQGSSRLSIEEESEAIWTTMTEIDLNEPSELIGGTLPRGNHGGILYHPSPMNENDMERINNEKNKTLNALALGGEEGSRGMPGRKKKKKNGKKKKNKSVELPLGEVLKAGTNDSTRPEQDKKASNVFSRKWKEWFHSGSTNKVTPDRDRAESLGNGGESPA